ncbi:hypothetical protein ValSw41_58 [Vibrio phage ValSw4_1]|nr:hypothetical protein ValSw41_58 [Vibrio phage ValSw4_1]
MSDKIPTDLTTINKEIASLLASTPETTDRGRLMHLLNAKAELGGGGDSGGGSIVYNSQGVKYTPTEVTEIQDPLPNGVMAFIDSNSYGGVSNAESVQISVNTLDGLSNGLLAAIAKTEDASKVQEWGYLAFYATQEASSERTELKSYAVRKINTVFLSDNSDSVIFEFASTGFSGLPNESTVDNLSELDGSFEWFFTPSQICAVSEGGGGDALGGLAGQSFLGLYEVIAVGGSPFSISAPNEIVVDAADSTITSVYLSLNNVDDIIISHAHSLNSTEVLLMFAPLNATGENTTDLRLFKGTFGGKMSTPNPAVPIDGESAGGFLTLEAGVRYKVYMINVKTETA